ncbi:hypothetical protein [Deinococcus fonticola]|uniref:hypothetical protein n=1 Tax=Deinococcus fonticola TaxID=2528713 RepID=UPI001074F00C|nr:hypothetical protein [Deinococcus fonticola]
MLRDLSLQNASRWLALLAWKDDATSSSDLCLEVSALSLDRQRPSACYNPCSQRRTLFQGKPPGGSGNMTRVNRVHVYRKDTLREREQARNSDFARQGDCCLLLTRSGSVSSGSGMFPTHPECVTLFAW